MDNFLKFFSAIGLTIIAFIGLINLNILMDHGPLERQGQNEFIQKFIFVKKHAANFEANRPIDFNNFNLSSLYRLSKNLKLAHSKWCRHNSSICKDLLSYSLAKEDWRFAEKLVRALCYDFNQCPLRKHLEKAKEETHPKGFQLNNFSTKKRLSHLIDRTLRETNIPINGIICFYAEKEYGYRCHWKNQSLVFFMDKSINKKSHQKCVDKNSIMDCWIDSRIKMKTVSNQLTKACTLDSSAACYQMALEYLKDGHQFLACKYFEKSCLLKFPNACLLLSSEYAKLGDNYSKSYFNKKACLYSNSCEEDRTRATASN